MIGAILSMRFIGKESWWRSIVFWAVYIVIISIITGMLTYAGMPIFAVLIAIAVFAALAHFWYKKPLNQIIMLIVVAFVIDVIIAAILAAGIIAMIGTEWATTLMPTAQFWA